MKYIVNNCDNYTNFDEDWTCRSTIQNRKGCYCCKDITDCLMKRIVKKCYKATHEDLIPSCDVFKTADDVSQLYGRAGLAYEILELLEIEECENER